MASGSDIGAAVGKAFRSTVAPSPNAPVQSTDPGTAQGQDLGNTYNASQAGPDATANYQGQIFNTELGMNDANLAYQTRLTQQDRDYQLAQLGLQGQSQAIQQGALNRQTQLLPQQEDLINQMFGIQAGGIARNSKYSLDSWNIDQATNSRHSLLNQFNKGFFEQEHGLNQADLSQNERMQKQGLQSDATAAGSLQTEGYGSKLGDIISQFSRSRTREGINFNKGELGFAETGASLNDQLAHRGISYMQEQSGMQDQLKSLGIAEKQEALSYGEKQAQLGDRQKNLDIVSQKMGMDRDQITTRANDAIQQLGLSNSVTADQIMQSMANFYAGRTDPLTNLIPMISQSMGVPMNQGSGGGY